MDILNIPATRIDRVNTSKLLLVGFNEQTYNVLNKYKNGSRKYQLQRIDSPFRAYRWLMDTVNEEMPDKHPRAILCDLQFLKDDDFRFLKKLQANNILKDIPFIVISTNGAKINTEFALQRGIDDCYSIIGLNWNNLKLRIEFLSRFKSEIANNKIDKDEQNGFKVPLDKRIFDVIFATGVLLFISPILILIAALIRLESKGPIFYLSKRAGSGFQVFDFIKFRSMYPDADKRLKDLEHLNQYEGNKGDGPSFVKLQNDPRVTKVGKLIRKTSLDELPQLINVLKGDMSIVGNRPLPLYDCLLYTSPSPRDS